MFGERRELGEVFEQLGRLREAIRLLAFVVIRDQNELNALLKALHAPTTQATPGTVTVTAPS
jgi:hypothetical protein